MSITIDRPTSTGSRILRKHTIITTQGMDGVLAVTAELRSCGSLVKEMSVDVREGVGCSALTCSVSMTADEAEQFASALRALPEVEAVDPY